MSSNLRPIDLVQAFLWTCDDCGQDNFERAIMVDPKTIDPEDWPVASYDQAEDIREFLDQGGEGDFVRAPDRVRCWHCQAEFKAIPL